MNLNMEKWVVVGCNNCGWRNLDYFDNQEVLEDLECGDCLGNVSVVKYKDINNAEIYLEIIGLELEDANWHSVSDLPYELYRELRNHDNDYETAMKISKAFYKNI